MAKSHIIPRSLYGDTLNGGQWKIISNSEGSHPKRSPIGVYDSKILCINCEAGLTKWDNYAYDLFLCTEPTPAFFDDGVPLAGKYAEIDCHTLQMFFISLVWRMQATQQEMFKGIQLGKYEKNVKSALLEGKPELVPELDVVVSKFHHSNARAFLGPTRLRIEGVNGYRIGFSLHSCWIKVDKRPFPPPFNLMGISNGNPLHILFQDFEGSPEKTAMVELIREIGDR